MSNPIHPRLEVPLAAADALIAVSRELIRLANQQFTPRRRKRGGTLRPGAATPMWSALSAAARAQLEKYGEKSRLGRILGVPPQRVHEYLMSKSSMPDAERTLLLLVWLSQKHTAVGEPG